MKQKSEVMDFNMIYDSVIDAIDDHLIHDLVANGNPEHPEPIVTLYNLVYPRKASITYQDNGSPMFTLENSKPE